MGKTSVSPLIGSRPCSLTVCSSTQGVDIWYHCHIVLFWDSWYMITHFSCVLLCRRIIRWFLQYFSLCQVSLWSSLGISTSIFSLSYIAILCRLLVLCILVISKHRPIHWWLSCTTLKIYARRTQLVEYWSAWNMFLSLMLSFCDHRSPSTVRSRQYSCTFMSFPIPFFYSYKLSISNIFCAIGLSRLRVERVHGGSWRMTHTLLTLCQIPTENKSNSLLWVKGN